MDNFNQELGYPYGTFDPRHTDLYEDIEQFGTNETELALVKSIREALKKAVEQWGGAPNEVIEEMVDTFLEHYNIATMIEEGEGDEYTFRDTDNNLALFMTHLGGAPLCYVMSSNWITWCRTCSPCVPGAGDLDTPGMTPGSAALCLPPDDMQELANANGCAYVMRNINSGEIVDIQPKLEDVNAVLQQ